jgi:hypothetical protein
MTKTPLTGFSRLLLLALAAGLGAQALAQTQQAPLYSEPVEDEPKETLPRYRVELIVFAYSDAVNASTEMWLPDEIPVEPAGEEAMADSTPWSEPEINTEPDEEQLREQQAREVEEINGLLEDDDLIALELAIDVVEDTEATRVLFPGELSMGNTLDRLERLDAYIPLVHAGWIQTVRDEEATDPLPLTVLIKPPAGLDGSVTLYMSRFLHLVLDLELDADWQIREEDGDSAEPEAPTPEFSDGRIGTEPVFVDDIAEPAIHYRILEDRKVKRNELHYFDHPKFGVIARITLEETEEEPEELPADLDTANSGADAS